MRFSLPLLLSIFVAYVSAAELELVICRDQKLSGGCTSIVTAHNSCYGDLTRLSKDGGRWGDSVTSAYTDVGPGVRQYRCKLWEHNQCTGRSYEIWGAVYNVGNEFNDIASSVHCWYT